MGLTRRSMFSGVGVGTIAILAGCSGSDVGGIGGGLTVDDTSAETTTFGNVVLSVAVSNTSGSSKSDALIGQVDMTGGDTYTERRDITVDGEQSNTYELEFDIDFSESLSASEFEYSARIES
ncbi:hypothetical protein [Natrinema soli]|uniref:Uncharacterized protein n=1 Tax=Natrinema soli TaxID=1930624 RepID=A0ABD5SN61_9EURY|nr:hypothetical protein [Natrinema soli]